MSSILEPRKNFKPFEYDIVERFAKPIWDSFWTVDHYNFDQDIHEFHVNLNDAEKEIIKRTSFATAQIEVKVKEYWGKIGDYFPKPEIKAVGAVFSANEVVHEIAYSQLLELLGFNDEFKKIGEIPALNDRVEYLSKHVDISKHLDKNIALRIIKYTESFIRAILNKPKKVDKDFIKSLILFSIFIENVSLFSQFLILKSFKKHKNLLKACNTVVTATSVEENLHASFGIWIINTLKKEHPEFFDAEMIEFIKKQCKKAYIAEKKVVDWIFEKGELEFMKKDVIVSFLQDRFNQSLEAIGIEKMFEANEIHLEEIDWFYVGLGGNARVDLFNSRATSYNMSASFTPQTVFGY